MCGSVENPEGQPLPLPDGIGQTTACSTDAQCTSGTAPELRPQGVPRLVHLDLNFVGFPQGATLEDVNKLLSVCVVMEHSWLRDLQMDLITPDGRVVTLHKFVDRTGGEIFLGQANDGDQASNPVPGVGAKYCWTPGSAATMLDTPTVSTGAATQTMPAGDYAAVSPWAVDDGLAAERHVDDARDRPVGDRQRVHVRVVDRVRPVAGRRTARGPIIQ